MTALELKALLAEIQGQESAPVAGSRRIQPTAKGKVTVVALEPGQTVATSEPKAPKAALVIPKGAQEVVYNDKTLVIRKIGKSGVNKSGDTWSDDYIEFAGFRGRFGDFSLTMNQARMLADENVYLAFQALMEQIPS